MRLLRGKTSPWVVARCIALVITISAISVPATADAHAAAAATARAAAPTAAVDAVRAAIAAQWRRHMDAAIRKDLAGVMEIYAEDIFYTVSGQEARGRDAMEEMEAATLQATDVIEAAHTTLGLNVAGNLAYEMGTITGSVRPKEQPAANVVFHFVAVWRQQADGAWRIQHLVGEPEAPAGVGS